MKGSQGVPLHSVLQGQTSDQLFSGIPNNRMVPHALIASDSPDFSQPFRLRMFGSSG